MLSHFAEANKVAVINTKDNRNSGFIVIHFKIRDRKGGKLCGIKKKFVVNS